MESLTGCMKVNIMTESCLLYLLGILEEVFASNKALWVSPDGKKVAYAKFDDTEVQTMKMPLYGEPGALTSQYTRIVELKYPKVI